MYEAILDEVLSSRKRLKIADMIGIRPRTLGELAEGTGVSMQAVLKHLARLKELGIVEERSIAGHGVRVRKVYAPKKVRVGDFSTDDLTIVKVSKEDGVEPSKWEGLESIGEDLVLKQRRVKDEARRLGRMVEDLMQERASMMRALEGAGLDEEELLILQVLYGEESFQSGEEALTRHYGLRERRKSIDRALAGAGKIGSK